MARRSWRRSSAYDSARLVSILGLIGGPARVNFVMREPAFAFRKARVRA